LVLFPEAGFEAIPVSSPGPSRAYHFRIAEHSRCFDGHFDGAPILPGVAHLALALSACAQQDEGGRAGTLVGVRDVRLRRKLGPGDEVEVLLTESLEPWAIRFEIRCHGETATVGILIFAPPGSLGRG
jgi:3-hydroxymyristoyl/3-hydroxydecanoyl-(acyl carrier protein) dehydratase